MSSFLLIVTLIIYSFQYRSFKKRLEELEDKITCIVDTEFWGDDHCDGKI